ADGNLAPALQSALHRFARPWYKIRTMSIFRDKTGLSVTPSLWGMIERALGESEYFLLMASPQAAASRWVKQEVRWWLTNRSAKTMLLLLTDGEIQWDLDKNQLDWSLTTALPREMEGYMAQHPLWVDLRWAKNQDLLSLRHPRFRDAILDIAATLLNKRKESLDSEDVRTYRRNRFAAGVAIFVSLSLAITAATLAVIARRDENEANAGRLAALATQHQDAPALAALLAIEGFRYANTSQVRSALLSTIQTNSYLQTYLRHPSPVVGLALSHDASIIASRTADGSIRVWNVASRHPTSESLRLPCDSFAADGCGAFALRPDGSVLAVSQNGVVRLRSVTSRVPFEKSLKAGEINSMFFSPNGQILATYQRPRCRSCGGGHLEMW